MAYIAIVLPILIIALAAMIIQQFLIGAPPFVHHAFICTAIFVLAAFYADKFGKGRMVKAAIGFALFGMGLGVLEILVLFIQPAFALETCLSVLSS